MKNINKLVLVLGLIITGSILSINRNKEELNKELIEASQSNEIAKVKDLIKAGADVNAIGDNGWTPIIYASFYGYKEIVELLIKAGANVNARNINGNTALIYASNKGHKEIVELLIKARADVDPKGKSFSTALIWATRIGHKEIVELLIKAGADVNAKDHWGNTSLMYASAAGNKQIVELLIKSGASVNIKDNKGFTALDIASENEIKDIITSEFEKKRQEISLLKKELFSAIESGNYNKLRELIKKVTLKVFDQEGNNPLHLAVILPEDTKENIENKIKIISLIVSTRTDLLKDKNNLGWTPIEFALSKGKLRSLEILSNLGY